MSDNPMHIIEEMQQVWNANPNLTLQYNSFGDWLEVKFQDPLTVIYLAAGVRYRLVDEAEGGKVVYEHLSPTSKGIVIPDKSPKQDPQAPQALDSILTERGSRYGKFKGHALITQQFKQTAARFVHDTHGVTISQHLSPSQLEALDMVFHKIGRILNGDPNYADSWVDIAGYTKLVADELEGKST